MHQGQEGGIGTSLIREEASPWHHQLMKGGICVIIRVT